MPRRTIVLLGLLAALILTFSAFSQTYGFKISTNLLFVHLDGKVEVSMVLTNTTGSSIQLTLLTNRIETLTVVDSNNNPLEFSLSGRTLTVYLQSTGDVSIHYSTNALTTKVNATWTLSFNSTYNATVIIPQGAALLTVTPNTAEKIQGSNQTLLMTTPGDWTITYTLNPQLSQPSSSLIDLIFGAYLPYIVGIFLTGGVALSYLAWRRRGEGLETTAELREEDRQILDYIRRKGGSAMLSEIRGEFHLPKSTSSRMARRLELT